MIQNAMTEQTNAEGYKDPTAFGGVQEAMNPKPGEVWMCATNRIPAEHLILKNHGTHCSALRLLEIDNGTSLPIDFNGTQKWVCPNFPVNISRRNWMRISGVCGEQDLQDVMKQYAYENGVEYHEIPMEAQEAVQRVEEQIRFIKQEAEHEIAKARERQRKAEEKIRSLTEELESREQEAEPVEEPVEEPVQESKAEPAEESMGWRFLYNELLNRVLDRTLGPMRGEPEEPVREAEYREEQKRKGYQPKKCAVCGQMFQPVSGAQRFCPECKRERS